jgi:hypothetical protein
MGQPGMSEVDDQRMISRSTLHLKDSSDRRRILSISAKTIDRLRWNRHKMTGAQGVDAGINLIGQW